MSYEPGLITNEEEDNPRRTIWVMLLIISLVVVGYAAVLFVGGRALQDAPLAGPIFKLRKGLENLSKAEPPKSLSELPPLAPQALGPSASPSPITIRVSPVPSPTLSPTFVAPEPESPSIVTFTIDYENTTGVQLTGVRITDRIPNGTSYRSGSASPAATFDGRELVWDIGTLNAGQKGTVTFQVVTRLTGRITNRATITSNEAPPGTIESSANV